MEVCRLLSWQNLSFYFVLNLDTEPIFRKLVLLPYCLNNSNTSHVPIYRVAQYNSRCEYTHSNTSHVPIYHNRLCFHKHYVAQFKYISYSYLSRGLQFKIQPLVQFKYISYSYLSMCQIVRRKRLLLIQMHLMFLFITRIIPAPPIALNSNTSHVPIYQ